MSADTAVGRDLRLGDLSVPYHWLAVGSTVVLVATYVSVLAYVTDIVGGTLTLFALVVATLLASPPVARTLKVWQATTLAAGMFVAGIVAYYLAVPSSHLVALSVRTVVADNLALVTGLSVLRMTEVGTWALGVAPGLVFVPWYLVLRRRYGLAVAAGGGVLGFFVLTGDAGSFVALVGALAATGALGFGTLARRGGTAAQVDVLAIVIVAMVVVSTTVSVVPGGTSSPIIPGGGAGPATVEGSLVTNDDRVPVVGSIRLSPKVRFTVEADRAGYWRVGGYNRYSGDGWIRTGEGTDYAVQRSPPGPSTRTSQTVTVQAKRLNAMPAAWKPIRLSDGPEDNVQVTALGSFDPIGAFREGEQFSVVSRVPNVTAARLRTAGTDYPDAVEDRYLQLPESTADRIRDRTDDIAADADNPYETAVAVESWLEENKEYSLEVDRPESNIAANFIFEMERGYCTYYATAMVAMLRSQGVPARFVVGYTPGQQVAEDEWVVRGYDSHAWVEAYFPDVGWVRFDPTPGGPRRSVENTRLEQARESNVSNVDVEESEGGTWTPTSTERPNDAGEDGANGSENASDLGEAVDSPLGEEPGQQAPGGQGGFGLNPDLTTDNGTAATGVTTGAGADGGPTPIRPPSREQAILGGLVSIGLLATARRTGVLARIQRAVWLRWQPRRDPETDVVRAFDRLEHLLGRTYRERRPGETPREYLAAVHRLDDRAERIGAIYERVRYAGEADEGLADEAVSLVDDLVRERVGRLGR